MNDRNRALLDLANFCTDMIPTELGNWPGKREGIEYANDLRLLARKVDAVVEAYGMEAQSSLLGISDGDLRDCFTNVMSDAIEGNATHIIEYAAVETEAMRHPEAAE